MTKLLITGASGYVASLMREQFSREYHVTLTDVTNRTATGEVLPKVEITDFMHGNPKDYTRFFEGVDVVIHLAYKHSSKGGIFSNDVPPIDRFSVENENVVMANNIYRAAYDARVKRIITASSNHAADWYEHSLVHSQRKDVVTESEIPVSDNFYGWSKAAYELLSWPYACGSFGRKMEFIHVRIGYPRQVDATAIVKAGDCPPAGNPIANLKRYLGAHLSARDCRQLFQRAIVTPNINDEHGIPFLVVYGISGNTRRFWSLDSAFNKLGYLPEDDSEVSFAEDIQQYLTGTLTTARPSRLG